MYTNTSIFRITTCKFYYQVASTQMISSIYEVITSFISILISMHLIYLLKIIRRNSFQHMTSQNYPSPFTLFDPTLLKRLQAIFWNYSSSKFSYPELSHRSQYYADVNLKSQELIASYFSVPNNYHVIYLASQAGYSAIPFNLVKITNNRAIYIVNDKQSQFAYKEAAKINQATLTVNTQQDRQQIASQYGGEPFYTFYNRVSKEKGAKNPELAPLNGEILVCNINYCAHYQTVNISNHGVVLFDSGHGFGLAGMTVAIVRKDLVGYQLPTCPDLMSFACSIKAKSIINTPYTLVPLLFIQYISYLDQNKQNHSIVKQHLQKIKEQFTSELKKKTEVLDTSSQGLLKIKIPVDFSSDKIQQFGWRVADEELVILLQQVNQGKASEFASLLFS